VPVTHEFEFDTVPPSDVRHDADEPLSDQELTALALAADPLAPVAEAAIPLNVHLSQFAIALPEWYMPSAMARSGHRWRLPVVLAIVSAFLLIEGLGLCNTYGVLSWA
jgi:hypothetical protein